jgi:hypothetical protein
MRSAIVVGVALVVLSGCAGADSKNETCAPSGSWHIVDTRTSASGGLCAGVDFGSDASDVQIAVDQANRTFTWLEDGFSFAGTINLGTCSGSVTTTVTMEIGTDADGNPVTLTAAQTRNVAFHGNTYTGNGMSALSTNVAVTDLPCSLQYTSSGTRQ